MCDSDFKNPDLKKLLDLGFCCFPHVKKTYQAQRSPVGDLINLGLIHGDRSQTFWLHPHQSPYIPEPILVRK